MPYTPDLDRLLTPGARYEDEDFVYVVEPREIGSVVLPTGQVVACDVVFADTQPPFTVAVEPGNYPLRGWMAVMTMSDYEPHERVAALQLVIRDEPVARWELGLVPGQDPADLDDESFFGYGVDSGTGLLADLRAVRALESWDNEAVGQFRAGKPGVDVVEVVVDEESGANIFAIQSGYGDGFYPTFVGYTAAGAVASFVTDFLVVPRDEPRAERGV